MKRTIVIITLTLLSISSGVAQSPESMNNWVFGWLAGLDFTEGSPSPYTGTGLVSTEGSVSYSDAQGNLLFYSNGGEDPGAGMSPEGTGSVWNRNFEMMPNGNITGLAGCNSSPQPALIIPKSESEYYMFTIGCSSFQNGLRKSIIDMTLDDGLGDLSLVGEVVLDNSEYSLAEGLTGTRHANGTDVWLVVHSQLGTDFHVFQITEDEVIGPVTQSVGSGIGNSGQLRFNIQGTKLAFNRELYDFDSATGVISNPIDIGEGDGWGRAFSPSGRYFYQSSLFGNVYQFDVLATDIAASKIQLADDQNVALGGMQIGTDLKIYISQYGATGLNVIEQPDMPGELCTYVSAGMPLEVASSTMGLPNFVDSDLAQLVVTVGVEEQKEITTYEIFPNPTSDFIVFDKAPLRGELSVYTLEGKMVDRWTLEENRLDVRELEGGVYMMHIGTSVVKFMKK